MENHDFPENDVYKWKTFHIYVALMEVNIYTVIHLMLSLKSRQGCALSRSADRETN